MDGYDVVYIVHVAGTCVNEVEWPVTEGALGEPVRKP
jgi:hypothetical protein